MNERTIGSYNLFHDRPVTVLKQSDYLVIIPTSNNLVEVPVELSNPSNINPNGVLRAALTAYSKEYDVILLDTPPNLDRLTLNALVASDQVIIPCQCQMMALEGLQDFVKTLRRIRELNPKLQTLAVIPTMYMANRKVEQEALTTLQSQFGELCRPPVPNRVEYLKASSEQRPVSSELFDYWKELAKYTIGKAGI